MGQEPSCSGSNHRHSSGGTPRLTLNGTEAVNLIIEKTRRLANGFRTFDHYRIRILLAASGRRPYRRRAAHG
jgi:hypothetical protein